MHWRRHISLILYEFRHQPKHLAKHLTKQIVYVERKDTDEIDAWRIKKYKMSRYPYGRTESKPAVQLKNTNGVEYRELFAKFVGAGQEQVYCADRKLALSRRLCSNICHRRQERI